jgi:hypothetical protein
VLPPLFTTAVAAFQVAESQALNTAAEPDARLVPAGLLPPVVVRQRAGHLANGFR